MPIARVYGNPPYKVFLIHGGPGAAGEMAPVARQLGQVAGAVEPLQSKRNIADLVAELKETIEAYSEEPVHLVGYSWGAWLCYIFAALHPELVSKLVLVSSGPFEAHYAAAIGKTRLSRLNEAEKKRIRELEEKLSEAGSDQNHILLQYGSLMSKADSYDPIALLEPNDDMQVDLAIFQSVWTEASEWRSNGRLLKLGSSITCPVVVMHGDYDPHPLDGVVKPLTTVIRDLKCVRLDHCGHTPWKERLAKDIFYELLAKELQE